MEKKATKIRTEVHEWKTFARSSSAQKKNQMALLKAAQLGYPVVKAAGKCLRYSLWANFLRVILSRSCTISTSEEQMEKINAKKIIYTRPSSSTPWPTPHQTGHISKSRITTEYCKVHKEQYSSKWHDSTGQQHLWCLVRASSNPRGICYVLKWLYTPTDRV